MTNSDSTFLITIGIITGVVMLVIVFAAFLLLRSESKQERPTPPTDEPKLIPPVEMPVTPPPKERPADALPSIPPVEELAASPPKEIPEHELPAMPSIEIVSAPPPKERTRIKIQLNPSVIRLLWGIWSAAVLMLVWARPSVIFIVGLAIIVVVAFRRAGPVSDWSLLQVAIGFLGWFVINTFLGIWLLDGDWSGDPWGLLRGFILFGVNILALLVLSLKGGQIIMGVFLAILVNAIGYLLFVEREEFGSFFVLPFFLHLFYPSL